MEKSKIDLQKEQQATLSRARCRYTFTARLFFRLMDLLTGRRTSFSKMKLLEILAGIPYRAWEIRQTNRLARLTTNEAAMRRAMRIIDWGRSAKDNEYWHLLLLSEKMQADRSKESWFLSPAIVRSLSFSYRLFARGMARFCLRRAFLFNAEFEDHAEHVYAEFVREHPELAEQPVTGKRSKEYGDFSNWADILRRILLDERDHRNRSFLLGGRPHEIVHYEGMPSLEDPRRFLTF